MTSDWGSLSGVSAGKYVARVHARARVTQPSPRIFLHICFQNSCILVPFWDQTIITTWQISLELGSDFTFFPHPSPINGRGIFPSSPPRNYAHYIIKFTDSAQKEKGHFLSLRSLALDVSRQAPLLKEIRLVLRAECLTLSSLPSFSPFGAEHGRASNSHFPFSSEVIMFLLAAPSANLLLYSDYWI